VCDLFGTWETLMVETGAVDELLSRQTFEHLSVAEARRALVEARRVLREDGILRLDVPDHEEALEKLAETGDRFYIRHLLGPRRNDYGYHVQGYNRDGLRSLVEAYGFMFVAEEENIHFYPAFCLRFQAVM
jgi:predicted SAM-dependent methyltransferase